MKSTYFKVICQRTSKTHTILMAVIPNDMLGDNLPEIFEAQALKMPATIYTGTYPQIKINTDTITARPDLKGMGAAGILTEDSWYCKDVNHNDDFGISI